MSGEDDGTGVPAYLLELREALRRAIAEQTVAQSIGSWPLESYLGSTGNQQQSNAGLANPSHPLYGALQGVLASTVQNQPTSSSQPSAVLPQQPILAHRAPSAATVISSTNAGTDLVSLGQHAGLLAVLLSSSQQAASNQERTPTAGTNVEPLLQALQQLVQSSQSPVNAAPVAQGTQGVFGNVQQLVQLLQQSRTVSAPVSQQNRGALGSDLQVVPFNGSTLQTLYVSLIQQQSNVTPSHNSSETSSQGGLAGLSEVQPRRRSLDSSLQTVPAFTSFPQAAGAEAAMNPMLSTKASRILQYGDLQPRLSATIPVAPPVRKKRVYRHESFPNRLFRILKEAEEAGQSDVISFNEYGNVFHILKATKFTDEIIPKYFRHSNLSSFKRQVSCLCSLLVMYCALAIS